ncbi:hypothetical protein GYMLUDRAFT_262797 [Collybiopsis luxurians FD-317 M1]|uniref:Epidermal growth factor receptor-like transmembrane-juxtamembrane segment domain-containing protein n=1 Tax=Collybiopsis luxurians FD-317 M1 TaxID=944289 RepID=A0A0D0CR14_9AGAR|nr:hypothetical protein GYMLUDRAFT_262797 [Collybiopsis luxurians FD-317 M1]
MDIFSAPRARARSALLSPVPAPSGQAARKTSLSRRFLSNLRQILGLYFSSPAHVFLSSAILFSYIPNAYLVKAVSTNITIDDTSSEFVYDSGWVAGPCDYCSAQLNDSLTFNGTWHDGGTRTGLSGQLNFDGTAVYLFGVTSQDSTGGINFTFDGQETTAYDPSSNAVPQVVHAYNFSLFALEGLVNGSHTLRFTTVLATNSSQTVLIDYAIVTVDNSPSDGNSGSETGSGSSSSTNSSKNSALIGGVVGGIAGAVLLSLAMFFFIRRRKYRVSEKKIENDVEPFGVAVSGQSFSAANSSRPSLSVLKIRPAPPTTLTSSIPSVQISLNSSTPVNSTDVSPSSASPSRSFSPLTRIRARSNSQAETAITDGTKCSRGRSIRSGGTSNTADRQHIQEMEERICSLETLVLLSRVSAPATASAAGGAVYGVSSTEDLTNPPPPY